MQARSLAAITLPSVSYSMKPTTFLEGPPTDPGRSRRCRAGGLSQFIHRDFSRCPPLPLPPRGTARKRTGVSVIDSVAVRMPRPFRRSPGGKSPTRRSREPVPSAAQTCAKLTPRQRVLSQLEPADRLGAREAQRLRPGVEHQGRAIARTCSRPIAAAGGEERIVGSGRGRLLRQSWSSPSAAAGGTLDRLRLRMPCGHRISP